MTHTFTSNRSRLAATLVLAATFACVSPRRADAQIPDANAQTPPASATEQTPPDAGSEINYVLTRLGTVNEGRLVDQGNAYLLEFEGGGSTLISKLDIVAIGPTRESIFRYKASKTHMEDVNEVLKLADWASRRRLGPEAIKTLQERLDASHDEAERRALQRKLDELKQAEAFRADAARFSSRRVSSSNQSSTVGKKELPPEEAELEAWGKKVPTPTLERFSRKAQPILQKRCSKSDCHGPDAQSQFTIRPKALGAAARLALFYNLRETLDYVDFEDAQQSRILNHPTVLNSKDERVYPFGNDRNSYKECQTFVEWLESLKSEQVLVAHAQATRRDKTPVRARNNAASRYEIPDSASDEAYSAAQSSASDAASGDSFAGLFEESSNAANAPSAPNAAPKLGFGVSQEALKYMPKPEDDPNSAESQLQRVGLRPKKQYRDAYDPAIFNDRYHQKK